jgi:hypothetical protein
MTPVTSRKYATSVSQETVKMSLVSRFTVGLTRARQGSRALSVAAAAGNRVVHGAKPLAEHDPEMHSLLQQEAERQRSGLELIGAFPKREMSPPLSNRKACVLRPILVQPV